MNANHSTPVVAKIFIALALFGCSHKVATQKAGWTEESIKQYLDDNKARLDPIEGIYSVNKDTETKMGKLSFSQKKNDVARVAIVRNNEGATPEFIEYILEGMELKKYSKTAEFTRLQKSSAYLCKRLQPDAGASYTFAYDESAGSLEGVQKGSLNTKSFNYLKIYPAK